VGSSDQSVAGTKVSGREISPGCGVDTVIRGASDDAARLGVDFKNFSFGNHLSSNYTAPLSLLFIMVVRKSQRKFRKLNQLIDPHVPT